MTTNKFSIAVAETILARLGTLSTSEGRSNEARIIFHGPSFPILEQVFEYLKRQVGETLPVLLQLDVPPNDHVNPPVGTSGRCNSAHLLNLRNTPGSGGFVALIPPGNHQNLSVSSTTDEFGMLASSNARTATFSAWWNDEYVQGLLRTVLRSEYKVSDGKLDSWLNRIETSAEALSDVYKGANGRYEEWKLLSRLYSPSPASIALSNDEKLELACGFPRSNGDDVIFKALSAIADAVGNGRDFAIQLARDNQANELEIDAISDVYTHIRTIPGPPAALGRSASAFYLSNNGELGAPPPRWWLDMPARRWMELLASDDAPSASANLSCSNSLLRAQNGLPLVVQDDVVLRIDIVSNTPDEAFQCELLRNGAVVQNYEIPAGHVGTQSFEFRDDRPPPHRQPLKYAIRFPGPKLNKSTDLKVISLESWAPGVVAVCAHAKKITPPKAPVGKRTKNSHDWESNLTLNGSGRYTLRLLLSAHVDIPNGATAQGIVDAGASDDGESGTETFEIFVPPDRIDTERTIEFEIQDRFQIDIPYVRHESETKRRRETLRIYVTCEEVKESGCGSVFEQLVLENRGKIDKESSKPTLNLDLTSRVATLQFQQLDEANVRDSYRPLVLSKDSFERARAISWDCQKKSVLSDSYFPIDPRPEFHAFHAPQEFIDSREMIARLLLDRFGNQQLIEGVSLYHLYDTSPEFRKALDAYVHSYSRWVAEDRDIALWSDVIAITPTNPGGSTLVSVPDAILLSPLHPLRLAWQCNAQRVLFATSNEDAGCPAASILAPHSVPDSMALPIASSAGIYYEKFVSVSSDNCYWSVLWNGRRLSTIEATISESPYTDDFGIAIGGITNGFSSSQISRALNDISTLYCAKPNLTLSVNSVGRTTGAFNSGVTEWCHANYSPDEKTGLIPISDLGPRRLNVFDYRAGEAIRPADTQLAAIAVDTDSLVQWYNPKPDSKVSLKADLCVLEQLETTTPDLIEGSFYNAMSSGALLTSRVRSSSTFRGSDLLLEARSSKAPPSREDTLSGRIERLVELLEMSESGPTCLQFTPNTREVNDTFEKEVAHLVAVSSSNVDPACFLSPTMKDGYLWDYELPEYSRAPGDNSGYYVISGTRDSELDALKQSLGAMMGDETVVDFDAKELLLEVARRGIPTVKGVSRGTSGAVGDIGVFIAARFLQDCFRAHGSANGLLAPYSVDTEAEYLTIIVPVDPFQGHLNNLREGIQKSPNALHSVKCSSKSRPDLLVISAAFTEDTVSVRLTPVEVKARTKSKLSVDERKAALEQCESLISLFRELSNFSERFLLWRLAFQSLLVSMVDFGMRVYSQQPALFENADAWTTLHARLIQHLLSASSEIQLDPVGRLIVLDDSSDGGREDVDGDGFAETITLDRRSASLIAMGDAPEIFNAAKRLLGTWELMPHEGTFHTLGKADTKRRNYLENSLASGSELSTTSGKVQLREEETDANEPTAATVASVRNLAEVPGVVLTLGSNDRTLQRETITINLSDTSLNHLNIGVVGDLGTGKTQMVQSLIAQIANAKEKNRGIQPNFLIFDYKRDYTSPDFIKATNAKVYTPTDLPLNPFDLTGTDESSKDQFDKISFFRDILEKIYSNIGPIQRERLKQATYSAYALNSQHARGPLLQDVKSAYMEESKGKIDSLYSILSDMEDLGVFTTDRSKIVDFSEFLSGVVVISLNQLGQDDRHKNMVVAILLNLFYDNMLRLEKHPYIGTNPQLRAIDSYLLVDEADNIMKYNFDVLKKILLEGREFGCGVLLSSQYMNHFKTQKTDYREMMVTWLIHKVPNLTTDDIRVMGLIADQSALSDTVKKLPKHHILYKTHDGIARFLEGLPFFKLYGPNP